MTGKVVLNSFEEASVGHMVLTELQAMLGESKRRAIDLEPPKREAPKLETEVKVNALAVTLAP